MSKPDITEIIDVMIKEQGETWLDALPDRGTTWNAVVVTDSPEYCYRLIHREGLWVKIKGTLTTEELALFFAAFGSHWKILLSSWIQSNDFIPIRAFIANGRKPRSGFSISIDASRSLKTDNQKAA